MSEPGECASDDPADEAHRELCQDNAASIQQWVSGVEDELAGILGLLDDMRSRRRDDGDVTDALSEMHDAVSAMSAGEMPSELWRVELMLRRGGEGTSGMIAYSLSVDHEGVRLGSYGSEWREGEGSESWSGATFELDPQQSDGTEGDLIGFLGEFVDAVGNSDFEIALWFEEEAVGFSRRVGSNEAAGESVLRRIMGQIVSALQGLPEDSSQLLAGDSGLANWWDEICAQQQSQESHSWELYVQMVEAFIADAVEKLDQVEARELWQLTGQAEVLVSNDEANAAEIVSGKSDTCEYVFERLMSLASDYANPRIIRFINRRVE